jgi:hypothetical protein
MKTNKNLIGKAFKKSKTPFSKREIVEWRRMVATTTDTGDLCAYFLFASSVFGPNEKEIARIPGFPLEQATIWADNLGRNGVWKDGKVDDDHWFSGGPDSVGFTADSLIAQRLVERNGVTPSGEIIYDIAKGKEAHAIFLAFHRSPRSD